MNNQAVNNEQSLAERLDWAKCDGMIPAIVQHAASGEVLMQGFMTREALDKTLATGQVTFFSRSKQRLWTKGESSGHVLQLVAITTDCDQDSLLIAANPVGPTCHLGNPSCFDGHPCRPLASWPSSSRSWQPAKARIQPPATPPAYMPRAPSASPRRWVKRVSKWHSRPWPRIGRSSSTKSADLLHHLTVLLQNEGLALKGMWCSGL